MPRRNIILTTGEIYHVFNRSIAKENIFSNKNFLKRALEIANYYLFPQTIRFSKFKTLSEKLKNDYLSNLKSKKPLIEIYSFAFMTNHHHFLLKQFQDGGIVKFISNFQNSFAKYYNLRNNRHGGLFQNPFKAKRVETEEEFIHVSRYIHLNPVTSYLIELDRLGTYPYTSFSYYLKEDNSFINTQVLLEILGSKRKFIQFVSDQVDYQRKLSQIKHLTLE